MINKIIASSLLFFLFIAIGLSLFGVEEVKMSDSFISFLNRTNVEFNNYKLVIPDIPKIPLFDESTSSWFLINIVNAILQFLNGLVTFLNFLVLVINTIISLLEFLFFFLKNLIVMRDELISQG